MMHVGNSIIIAAPPSRIYALAAPVERWPALLPHYRWVKVLEDRGDTRLVEMACWRGRIPLRWTALEELLPEVPRIRFLHVAGATRGMEVAWEFLPHGAGTQVRIEHDLRLPWPIIGPAVADRIIGPLFVQDVANKTLQCMKRLAESVDGG
jgi:ribosome-associated toxin RatA of RatAB toxin-antitoxin module